MHSLTEIKEHYFKTKEEHNAYEKKNYSGIALCCITADTVG